MPSADPSAPSLALSKPFSISLGSKTKPKASLSNGPPSRMPKKRPHSALADPDSENEDPKTHVEAVTGFDSGKAISAGRGNDTKAPLIIKAEKNRDWREDSRRKRGKNLLPAEVQASRNGVTGSADGNNGDIERAEVSQEAGLKFVPKQDQDGDIAMAESVVASKDTGSRTSPQTADEEALAALMGAEKKSTFTIPSLESTTGANGTSNSQSQPTGHVNEDDRFRADVASRPESASLADYNSIPVEEFGAALMRGMGWKEGDPIGKRRETTAGASIKPKEVQRRPALLGIGAKESPGGAGSSEVELGAWSGGRGGKGKKGAKAEVYNPIMLKNSQTGEMITEEELELRRVEAKVKRERGETKEEDWRERRDRNLTSDGNRKRERLQADSDVNSSSSRRERNRDRSRNRERDNDRDRDRRDYGSSRRERSRSEERDAYKSSSKRHRDRSGERSRHEKSRRERSRSSDRRHRRRDYEDDRRDRDRDRDRDRNRDRERDRDRDKDYRRH